mgnify:FL=1
MGDAWSAVHVRADVASDMYWQSAIDVWRRDKDYPPMRLPYPKMWIEWDQPATFHVGREVKTTALFDHTGFAPMFGALIRDIPIPASRLMEVHPMDRPLHSNYQESRFMNGSVRLAFPKKCAQAIDCHIFTMREGMVVQLPFRTFVFVDAAGQQITEPQYVGPSEAEGGMFMQKIQQVITPPCLLAIGLMNCKNITTEEHESPVPVGRKGRRRKPDLTYHTINVPGYSTGGVGTGQHPGVAFHRVRGHFKTFTPEAPLMGQHVGTYWWGWQVRGKKELGSVLTDYKVGAAS